MYIALDINFNFTSLKMADPVLIGILKLCRKTYSFFRWQVLFKFLGYKLNIVIRQYFMYILFLNPEIRIATSLRAEEKIAK